MANFDEQLQRYMDAIGVQTPAALAEYLGMDKYSLSSWKRAGAIPERRLKELQDQKGIRIAFIRTGRGRRHLTPDELVRNLPEPGVELVALFKRLSPNARVSLLQCARVLAEGQPGWAALIQSTAQEFDALLQLNRRLER